MDMKMKMKIKIRKIMALVMPVIFILTSFAAPTAFAEEASDAITVRVHYLRSDGNYTDWSVWMWTDNNSGAYEFDSSAVDEKGAVAVAEFTDNPQKIGFIVRKGDWEAKDPDGDRFIEVNDVISGTIDVFCVSGSAEFDVNTDNAVKGVKLLKAGANSKIELTYELSVEDGAPTKDDFKIVDPDNKTIEVTEVTANGKTGTIKLSAEIDYLKIYTISYKGGKEIKIQMPDYYSSVEFEEEYTYNGNDLGAVWSAEKTDFRVWAPTASKIELNLYKSGDGDDLIKTVEMTKDVKGTWVASETGDLNGTYYTYTAHFGENNVEKDIVDPYARTVGVNGMRGMVINLDSTDPEDWANDTRKVYNNPTDLSIYELHIRDFSIDEDSGIKNSGKYIAFTESGTKNSEGTPTGIDHLKDLGITSVHILPSYDYASVDESKNDSQYNWGYDPQNYNAPEGSYSTDPYHGEVRVNEYKQMVQALHNAGIGVIMDVVYNHTYNTSFSMNRLVPDYYYRPNSNGSGCGNDVASERSMVRKFIVDSVSYWANEYHLDGFRFDLMGLEDVETMNAVNEKLKEIDPDIYVYGEGWTLDTATTKNNTVLATQPNASKTPSIGYFSDNIRDAIKGSVFNATEKGFVNGNLDRTNDIKDGIKGTQAWSPSPSQTINYSSCHDNLALWDKINSSNGNDSEESKIKQNLLAAAIVYTSQGVPFIQAGEEFLRTKVKADGTFDENSYASPDSVNLLDYSRIDDYADVYNYYKGLIELRKNHPAFRMSTKEEVDSNLSFIDSADEGIIAYTIDGKACGDSAEKIMVIFNGNPDDSFDIALPDGDWDIYVDGSKAGNTKLNSVSNLVTVDATTAMVLMQGVASTNENADKDDAYQALNEENKNTAIGGSTEDKNAATGLTLVLVPVMTAMAAVVISKKRKN